MKKLFIFAILFSTALLGAAQSPELVLDANPDLQPVNCSDVNSEVYFAAWENLSWQPWKSDGTASGTARIKTIIGGSAGFDKFVEMNGLAFFYATTPASGKELWRSDGTEAGTYMIKDIKPGSADGVGFVTPVVFNNRIYFAADDGQLGMELWSTNGTEAGTTPLDIITGPDGSNPNQLTVFNGVLYFVAEGLSFWSDPNGVVIINGREVFKTDGSLGGTSPVNATQFSSAYREPFALTVFQNNLYFSAESADYIDGRELWKSDGTAGGTVRVKNIHPISGSSAISQIYKLFPTNNFLFFPANDNVHGTELWRSDGTEAGTQIVIDLEPGLAGSINHMIASTSNNVFFSRNMPSGIIIFASDGTESGTVNLQKAGQLPDHIVVNNQFYFTSRDNTNFWAIWQSDGTLTGTTLLADIDGALDQTFGPSQYANVNGVLFFRANDGIHGTELWKIGFNTGTPERVTTSGISVFPNPASELFTLELPAGWPSSLLRVFTAGGREILQLPLANHSSTIDCSTWTPGLYFLQVLTTDRGIPFCEKIQIE